MSRFRWYTAFLIIAMPAHMAGLALAEDDPAPANPSTAQSSPCEACDERDINQIGAGLPPYQSNPHSWTYPDQKGRRYELPFGNQKWGVYYKSGSGIWLGDISPSSNIYLKPNKDRMSLGLKVDF
jgi:hypothetical protein